MSLIAFLFARCKRAAFVLACIGAVASPALGQSLDLGSAAQKQGTAPPVHTVGAPIRQIVVRGTQRIEEATVVSYLSVHQGDAYDEAQVDASLKTLFAT